MQRYDYIFLGAGAAGLSLLMRLIDSGHLTEKRILLIDRKPKLENDRTWCFWEHGDGYFEHLVAHRWPNIAFNSPSFSTRFDIAPYRYKMIRGIDFYEYCFAKIAAQKNADVRYGEISAAAMNNGNLTLRLDDEQLTFPNTTVFNSLHTLSSPDSREPYLLQHFKGWLIETDEPIFDAESATLMDFRVSQEHGTSFAYVLPRSAQRALVEFTVFSERLLAPVEYSTHLERYISEVLNITAFKIVEQEFGVIPMTNQSFPFYDRGMYNIGTAGGQTKASTGYTFRFIQKQSDAIAICLLNNISLRSVRATPRRFAFYDGVFLRLLAGRSLAGRDIFVRLFQKNKPATIFRFLDNESSASDELSIITSLQIFPFLKSAIKQIF